MNNTTMLVLEELPVADVITSKNSITVKLESSKPQSSSLNATFSDLTEIPLAIILGLLSKTDLKNVSLVSQNLRTVVQERIFTKSKKHIFKTLECGTQTFGVVIRWLPQKFCSLIHYEEIDKFEIILWGTDYNTCKTVKHEVDNRLVQKKGMKVTYDGMTGTVVENKQPNNLHILKFGNNLYRVATYEEIDTLYMIDDGDHYVDETVQNKTTEAITMAANQTQQQTTTAQHAKAYAYAMTRTVGISISAMRKQKRKSKRNVKDSAKEFKRLQNEGGAQTGRLLQLSQDIHFSIHDKTVFDSSSTFFDSFRSSFENRRSDDFIWEELDGLIETIKAALNYRLHHHVSKATKILLAAKNSVKAVDQKIKWFEEAEKVLKDASINGDLLSVLSDHDELHALYVEVQNLLPGHFSDNDVAMKILDSGSSNTSKVSFKSESLAFNQETESKEVTIAKTLSESCAQSRNSCSDDSMTSPTTAMLANNGSGGFSSATNGVDRGAESNRGGFPHYSPDTASGMGGPLKIGSSDASQRHNSSTKNCDNQFIDSYNTPTRSRNYNVKFGQVNEALFELEPGSADSVPADSQYKFCKGGFALQLAGEAIKTSSYPCRSQHSSVSHMNLSERRDRYENTGPNGLLNAVDELQDRIKIVQDERDRYKAKSETFEVRSETAIEALNVQGGGGDVYTHLVNQNSILRTKNKDLEVNQELAKQRVEAFSKENNRFKKQLFPDVKRSNKQRVGRGSVVKSAITYDKQDNKRMRFK